MQTHDFKFKTKDINPFIKVFSKPNDLWAVFQVTVAIIGFTCFFLMAISSLTKANWLLFYISQFFLFGFYLRAYGLMHDCGHESLFSSARINDFAGNILSLILLKSYKTWKIVHNVHHSVSGKLHKRADGADLPTVTVKEFQNMSAIEKIKYRIIRNPFFLLGLLPFVDFFILDRIPISKLVKNSQVAKISIYFMNVVTILFIIFLISILGLEKMLILFLPYFWAANSFAILFFYVSHQFEKTYWEKKDKWNIIEDAFIGSSYFKLPFPLDWFCTDIGIHHIHHMTTRVPNYNLRAAHKYLELHFPDDIKQVSVIRLKDVKRVFKLKLWDEDRKMLVPISSV